MTLLDSSQPAPDQGAPAALPDAHALFPDIEEHHDAAAGASGHLPDANDLFPDMPEPAPRRPITGAVAPGPVGDWIFGNTQHSSLARIMDAFGATVDQDIGHYGEKLGLSEETSKALRDKGIFNDYAQGQHNIGKALNETLLRSGAVLVNGAIYGVPAVWHGLAEAVVEAGEQVQGTELGKAVNARGFARSVAAIPEAIPDFNFGPGNTKSYGQALMRERSAPVPAPLAAARDLNVIGPGGEAAWKGVGPEVSHETGGPTVPVEAAAAEALPSTPAAAPDVHTIARSIAPEIFTEFDTLEKRRDLFRKWIDEGGAQVPPNVAQNLKETEARLRELEPAVTAAYSKAKEGLPAITEAENAGGSEAANPSTPGAPEAQAAAAPTSAPEEGAVPAEGTPSTRVAGEAGAEAAPRSIEDQRDHIVNEVKQSLIDAGRPSEEAQAAAQLVAARYEARAARFNGALGTPQELFDRESSDIRKMERVAKSTKRLTNPNSARALDDFQGRMAQAKELRRKATESGGGSARIMSAEERFAGVTEGEWKAQLEDSIEALEPEERQSVREDLSHLPAEDLAYLAERAEAGLPLFQIEAYHGSPHHFERFDISKIGTGEGAQAYGHGLYFAENEGVAKQYRSALSKGAVDWDDPHAIAAHFVDAANGNRDDALFQSKTHVGIKNFDALKKAQDIIESGAPVGESRAGALYRVSLKPDKEDLLDWDKPLSEQSEKVKAALKAVPGVDAASLADSQGFTGGHLVETLGGRGVNAEAVSKKLAEAGIPGIKYADAGSRAAEGGTHNFVIFDDKDVEITHRNGEALSKQERADAVQELYQRPELNQKIKGSFLPDVANYPALKERPRLEISARRADASTFIHESGHEWLEQLMRDAVHPLAPPELKADAKTVMDWLGIKEHQDLNTGWPGQRGKAARAAHEKFATGFEQYLRLGIAPSPQLDAVFAKFKAWLTRIYQTLKGSGEPISEDIRGVFDRMLTAEPQRVVAGAEREGVADFHERHAALAETTAPEHAPDVADEIQNERDFIANDTMLNEHDARLENTHSGAGRRPAGIPEPAGHADEAGTNSGKARAAAEAGDIVPGGGEAAPASHRTPPQPQPTVKTEPPPSGNSPFAPGAGKYTDKIGNFRIDGLNDPNQIFDALRENIEKTGGMVEQFRRGVTDGDLLNISLASGLKPEWLDGKKIGDAYSHREIKALEELFIAASTAVKDTVLAAATGEPTAILAQAEAMARMEMVQAHLAGASAEAGRALGAVRRVMKKAWGDGGRRTAAEAAVSLDRVRQLSAQKWESPEALSAALKAETGRTLFQLQEMAEFAGKLDTPGRIARLVADTSNGKMKQAVVFYYVNSLLSGPVTHLRYAVGNAITALYSPVRTSIAAGVDFGAYHAGLQNERRIFLGEAGAELYALGRGFTEGVAAGKEGWRIGTTPDLPGEGAPELFGAQPVINPIPGKIGYAIGIPGKGVGLVHGFGAAMRYRQELNRLAYRTAMQEKLQGDAFTARVADLSDRPPAENMEAAAKVARSDLYMAPTDYNTFTAALSRASDSSIVAKIILPFVKIGMQIESKAVANSPLALAALVPVAKGLLPRVGNEIRADLAGINGPEARTMRIASITGGTGLMVATASMVANGDMTGHGPHDKAKREIWLKLHKPYSVSIGPLTLNYQGWGYLGKLMGIAANAYETHQGWGDEEGHSIATAYYLGFHEALLDDSFLRGVKDMIDAVYDPERYGDRYIANMLLNWVPASVGMGQVARLVDPYQRETHTSADGVLDTLFKEAWNKVPFASEGLYPKRDVFGQPIRSGGVNPDYVNDPVVKTLDSLHIGISDVHDQIRGVKLTDKQFDDYKIIAGVATKMHLDSMMKTTGQHLASTGRPEDRAKLVELVHKIVKQAREKAATAVMMHSTHSDNDIWAKATEAKKVKKGIIPAPTVH